MRQAQRPDRGGVHRIDEGRGALGDVAARLDRLAVEQVGARLGAETIGQAGSQVRGERGALEVFGVGGEARGVHGVLVAELTQQGTLQRDSQILRQLIADAGAQGDRRPRTEIHVGGDGALRLTTARYYTPSGRSIQAKGIDADIVIENCGDAITQTFNDCSIYRQTRATVRNVNSNRAAGFSFGLYFSSWCEVDGVVGLNPVQRGPKFAGDRFCRVSNVMGEATGSTGVAISQGSSFNTFSNIVATLGTGTPGNRVGLWFADQRCTDNLVIGVQAHGFTDYALFVGTTDTGNFIVIDQSGGVGGGIQNLGGAAIVNNGAVPAPLGFNYVTGAGNQILEVASGGAAGTADSL